MAKLVYNGVCYDAALGSTLAQAIGLHHAIEQPCAGMGRCGKCRVQAGGALAALSTQELLHLTPAEQAQGIRLACQCRIAGDCTVTSHSAAQQAPTQIQIQGVTPTFALQPSFAQYGIAIDLGTTTLAAQLYAANGTLLAQASAQNPQLAFGADVISRIEGALQGKGTALAHCIQTALAGLIYTLCAEAGVAADAVEQVVTTGNTAMLYLLCERDPASLSHAPFTADYLFDATLPAASLGLPCGAAQVYLPPCISAFVGADITTALLASEICDKTQTALLADIGTNGEMALWHGGQLICCSTAAGPAFEGAGLSMGMAAKQGAIDAVALQPDGGYTPHVIGDIAPLGICGSGIIDAIACFLRTEAIDETGLLEEGEVVLGGQVRVTQSDVRMVQLAKSAICAGLTTLVASNQLCAGEVAALCIAGGFGRHINLANAVEIGLLPAEYLEKTRVIGNAALSGAVMLLLNQSLRAKAATMAQNATTLDLSASPLFAEQYMMGMLFGEDMQA